MPALFLFEYTVNAETDWAFIDFATRLPKRIPPEIAGAFEVISR
jgi:acyl-CoA thioesterase FadM